MKDLVTLAPAAVTAEQGAANKTMTAGTLISAYTDSILLVVPDAIPAAVQKIAPDYKGALIAGKGLSVHFTNDIHPMLVQNTAHLVSYTNQWSSMAPVFKKMAKSGDSASVIQGLKLIQNSLGTYKASAKASASALSLFAVNVGKNAAQLHTAYVLLMSEDKGIKAQIDAQQNLIDAQQKVITDAAIMIAAGAVGVIGGVALLVGGGIADVFTGGATTSVCVAGALVAAGGVAAIATGSVMIDKASKQIATAKTTQARLKATESQVISNESTAKGLSGHATAAVSAIDEMATAWETMESDIDMVIGSIKQAEKSASWGAWFGPLIDATTTDFAQLNKVATNCQGLATDSSRRKFSTVDLQKGSGSMLAALPKNFVSQLHADEKNEMEERHTSHAAA